VDRYQYLAVMACCILITLPLEFVLGARVYRQPKRLLLTLVPAFIVFFTWDAVAVARETWTFAPEYVTGWQVPFSVPVEEVVFFVVIPICALLTYEVVNRILERARG
jgi:lycopene cyclase domain-containing protein